MTKINIGGIEIEAGLFGDELLKLNQNITPPTSTQTSVATKQPSTTTPSIITTDDVRNQFRDNVDKLGGLESRLSLSAQLSESQPQFSPIKGVGTTSPNGEWTFTQQGWQPTSSLQAGGQVKGTTATALPQPERTISIKSSNPALQAMIDKTNEMLSQAKTRGIQLPSNLLESINQINNLDIAKISAIANAREAAEVKDAEKLNEALKKEKEAEKQEKTALEKLFEELSSSRASLLESLKPSERETELRRNLQKLRTERQLLPLELKQEGISAEGIAARQVGDERVRAIQESNLLFELGLEQEGKKLRETVAEKQAGFIKDDIDLRLKIEETLKKDEKEVLDRARNLRKDSLSALSDIIETFEGLDFDDLDDESKEQLLNTANQFNIPFSLLTKAMANAKKQKIFENAIKAEKTKKTIFEEKDLTPDLRSDVIDTLTDEKGLKKLGRKLTVLDLIKLFPNVSRETLQSLMDEFLVEVDFEDKGGKQWWQFWK